jgi:hypothetical protein
MQKSPLFFINCVWGLTPQPVKSAYSFQVKIGLMLKDDEWKNWCKTVRPEWFEPFEKGKHVTWQQWLVLVGVEKALKGDAPKKISVVSGHGTGKSATQSWLLLWYLFCFPDSQVPCTAPTAAQMFDVLWKEVAKWIEKMPENVKAKYDWSTTHVRMKESPETWFARAKTATKENTEALAGVHADHVLIEVDEGSGVEDATYNTAEGALTNENILVVIISNGTRSVGYFYDTHHKDAAAWQLFAFSSEDSPIVDSEYSTRIAEKHGVDSDEYRIRVQGKFPNEGAIDDKGYTMLLKEYDIHEYGQTEKEEKLFQGPRVMGIDPSGEGKDKTTWFIRDRQKGKKVLEEAVSNPKTIAAKTLTLCELYDIPVERFRDIVVDNFGQGANVAQEIAIMTQGKGRVTAINTGELSELDEDAEQFINKKAECAWNARKWMQTGGSIVNDKTFKDDAMQVRYKRTMKGKIQIESKVELKKRGVKSPDAWDAFTLTFLRDMPSSLSNFLTVAEQKILKQREDKFDRFSTMGE